MNSLDVMLTACRGVLGQLLTMAVTLIGLSLAAKWIEWIAPDNTRFRAESDWFDNDKDWNAYRKDFKERGAFANEDWFGVYDPHNT